MDNTRIRPIFFRDAEISSAAWGITLNPIKKKGVITATARVFFTISVVVAPTKYCPSKLAAWPVIPAAAMRTMPTAPMIKVRPVCKIAAVLAPTMLTYVIRMTRLMAKTSHVA